MTDIRNRLFRDYYGLHLSQLDQDAGNRGCWFKRYFEHFYLPHLRGYEKKGCKLLEIGCSKGFLLQALRDQGFSGLHGVDLSQETLDEAAQRVPEARLWHGDVKEILAREPQCFDVIVLKAVLEHVPKEQVFPLLEQLHGALRDGGVLLIDVPNMDWLLAGHERYMDFTHEVGFTRESLRQLMLPLFPDVVVSATDDFQAEDAGAMRRLLNGIARWILGTLLRFAVPFGRDYPIWERSLLAVAHKTATGLGS